MKDRKTAVVDDFSEFTIWLATTPFVVWGSQKLSGQAPSAGKPRQESSSKPDADLLAALKSMA